MRKEKSDLLVEIESSFLRDRRFYFLSEAEKVVWDYYKSQGGIMSFTFPSASKKTKYFKEGLLAGFEIGVKQNFPSTNIEEVRANAKEHNLDGFFRLLELILNRFAVSFIYNHKKGLSLCRTGVQENPNKVYNILSEDGDILTISKEEIMLKLHSMIENVDEKLLSLLYADIVHVIKSKQF